MDWATHTKQIKNRIIEMFILYILKDLKHSEAPASHAVPVEYCGLYM
jgi:hypothetical protein